MSCLCRHMPLFLRRGGELDTELAANCTTIRQFDDAITRVAFGASRTVLEWRTVLTVIMGRDKMLRVQV